MDQAPFDDELLDDYLLESCELLANIEPYLLAMEQDGAEIDERLVNRVFRAAHSIRGGAGFFDLVNIRELAHNIETALDLIRCRQMVPTADVVTILLRGFSKLRELIQNCRESGEPDIAELVATVAGLTEDHLPAGEKHLSMGRMEVAVPETRQRVDVSAFDLNQARRSGQCIYLMRYDLIHDIQRRGKTPWEVFKCLIQTGTIMETFLDLDSAGTLDGPPSNQLLLEVVYATAVEPEMIGRLGVASPQRVLLIEKNRPSADTVVRARP